MKDPFESHLEIVFGCIEIARKELARLQRVPGVSDKIKSLCDTAIPLCDSVISLHSLFSTQKVTLSSKD